MIDDVIKAYVSPDKKTSLEAALTKIDDLKALAEEAADRAQELDAKDIADLSDEEFTELQTIAEILKTVRVMRNQQVIAEEAAKERTKAVEEAKHAISELGKQPESNAGEAEEAPAVEDMPDPGSEEGEKKTETITMNEPAADVRGVEDAAPAEAKELVGASVGGASESFRSVSSLQSPPPPVAGGSLIGASLSSTFAVDSGNSPTDRKYGTMKEVVQALTSAASTRMIGERKTLIAQHRRKDIEEFNVLFRDGDVEVIENVIANGTPKWDRTSMQFAAGWCAPSESLYELCPYVTSLDGIVDLPEVVASRGGVRTTSGPNFATIYANASIGQVLTEAQVIAATPKTCIEIDCPPFVETRLDVNPLCITGNLLTQAAYPEYGERFIRESFAANAHKINLNILTRMVTASTAVTLPGATGPLDTSSASWFLDAASLYAVWLRDRYRLRQDALIEVVAPYWYFQQMYSDLSRRNGVDMLTAQARLREAFAERNIRVQWVYDWQPMAGTAAGAAARPTTVQILVYIPGTFVKLTSPVINLGVIHSAAQLTLNQYTALFVEEGFNLLERCFEGLVLTVPTCPSGTTGAASGSCDSTP